MNAHIYIEGSRTGENSKEEQIRCRRAFRALFEKAGLSGRMPRLSACGGRESAFNDFKTAHTNSAGVFVAMLVDSEDPVANIEKTWDHLKHRDKWERPADADDSQVFLMATCMETWIVADRESLRKHYGHKLQENALPPANDLEKRDRHNVQNSLIHATRNCANAYAKGKCSFDVLAALQHTALNTLSNYARMVRILKQEL